MSGNEDCSVCMDFERRIAEARSNGVSEKKISSIRNDFIDHVIECHMIEDDLKVDERDKDG